MTEVDYQKLSEELDEVLAKLQSSDIDVDKATAAYERGMEITRQLEKHLKTAKNKVERIKNKFG